MEHSKFIDAVEAFTFNGETGVKALTSVLDGIIEGDDTSADGSYSLDYAHEGLVEFIKSLDTA